MKAKYCTPLQRRDIIGLWLSSTTTEATAKRIGVAQITVNEVVAAYKRQIRRTQTRYPVRVDIMPVDYSGHDEYNRHFAGCEFEDNRKPQDRGKDWPPKGYLCP